MIDTTPDTKPLTALSTDPAAIYQQLKTTHRPITLTVDDQPAFVLQEAAEYLRLRDLAAFADATEGIRQGLEESICEEGEPASKFFAELYEKHGISR